MYFIDTHTHLYSDQFNNDRNLAISTAIKSGVKTMLLPNISSQYTEKMLSICKEYPDNCLPMTGVHPCYISEQNYKKEITHVEHEISQGKYKAVGEIGLDLYWEQSTLEIQKKAFIHQIKLAKKYNLPVVIHVRDAFDEAIKIVEMLNDANLKGVFHCFTGNLNNAKRIIKLKNFYLGIGGVLTFKNSGLEKAIKNIDMQHLVLETDSPYLAPSPKRGKRNESKYIINIAQKLSEVKQISIEKVAELTSRNAKKLFNI